MAAARGNHQDMYKQEHHLRLCIESWARMVMVYMGFVAQVYLKLKTKNKMVKDFYSKLSMNYVDPLIAFFH